MGLSNLPPGVTDSMLPGNRPEDIQLEKELDRLGATLEGVIDIALLSSDVMEESNVVELLLELVESYKNKE